MKHLFQTKQGFSEARRKTRVSYNSRSAYMKTHALNAVTVKQPWDLVKSEGSASPWKTEAKKLTNEGNNVYVKDVSSCANGLFCMFTSSFNLA